MAPGSAARILAQSEPHGFMFAPDRSNVTNINPLTILIVVPTLQAGAADVGVVDLVRILAARRQSADRAVERRPPGNARSRRSAANSSAPMSRARIRS